MRQNPHQLTIISTLAHCISTNSDYDMREFPTRHMAKVAKEYKLLQAEIARNPDTLKTNASITQGSLDKIRDRLIELNLI